MIFEKTFPTLGPSKERIVGTSNTQMQHKTISTTTMINTVIQGFFFLVGVLNVGLGELNWSDMISPSLGVAKRMDRINRRRDTLENQPISECLTGLNYTIRKVTVKNNIT
jgi:hypothetical protein